MKYSIEIPTGSIDVPLTGPQFVNDDGDWVETYESYAIKMNELGQMVGDDLMRGKIEQPPLVAAIARGGMSPGEHVARGTGQPAEDVVNASISQFNEHNEATGNFEGGQRPTRDLVEGRLVIVTEDVVDGGGTMDESEQTFYDLGADKVLRAAVIYKGKEGSKEPDYYVAKTETPGQWVNFPTRPIDLYGAYVKEQMKLPPEQRDINKAVLLG